MKIIIAFIIALRAHKGKKDKAGRAYILHPINVMRGVRGYKTKIVALLHDVVEDSNYTLEKLSKYFDEDIIVSLNLLTKKSGIDYKTYIRNIKLNKLARQVKIADLKHNMNLHRLKKVTKSDLDRVKKYKKSLEALEEI